MSKSLGNSPEPLNLIKKYSADGVRVGMLLCSPAGGDLLYDDSLPEQGRNFGNKIWNAFRLVKQWEVDNSQPQHDYAKAAIKWFQHRLNQGIQQLEDRYKTYKISEALMTIYRLFWDEFSAWYLESVKPVFGQPIDSQTYNKTLEFLDKLVRLLHPFMPFITEEIWQLIEERPTGASIMIADMPKPEKFDKEILKNFEEIKDIVTGIRKIRQEKNIPNKDIVDLIIKDVNHRYNNKFESILYKLCNLSGVQFTNEKIEGALSFRVRSMEFYIPSGTGVDIEKELKKLNEELKYTKGFLKSVMAKLNNERFIKNAPQQVVDNEQKKKTDAENKIRILEERIADLQ